MFGSPTRTRTRDQLINSQSLYQLSYRGIAERDFRPAPESCQADSSRFKRSIASFRASIEDANDSRI